MSKIALLRTKSFPLLFAIAVIAGIGIAFAVEDPGADTLPNLADSALWTGPNAADMDADGLNDNVDNNPLSRAVILWGNPDFTVDDSYVYTGPDWWLGAGKVGGAWVDGSCWELAAGERGQLYIDIDRSRMNSDLVLNLLHQDVAECEVYLDLGDTNGTVMAEDLYGDMATGDGCTELDRFLLPLTTYTNASRIIIDATATDEPYAVWATTLYVDMDGDGLDADQEAQAGTSDQNVDCDGDGLSDYEEMILNASNPLKADSDGDGLDDRLEILAGSNLLETDSDSDGLDDAEEYNQLYYLSDNPLTWPDAKAFAEASGGHLAVITSLDELNVIKAALPEVKSARPWLGATDIEEEGVWKWVTGEAFDYARWGEGEPNNYKCPEMYLRFKQSYYWDDASEESTAAVLIEYSEGLNPLSSDTDGDGLSDADEVNIYKSNAHAVDSDGDGLSDADEVAAGTNPNLVDTDGDSLSDPVEIDAGLDPLNADTDGDGLGDGEEALQIYQLVDLSLTWDAAKTVAENFGGHLAAITSEDEIYSIAALLPAVKQAHPWVGAYEASDGVWQWVTGETFDYTRWDKNEPNDYKGPESYVRLINKSLKWNDEGASVISTLLVEYSEGLDPLNPDTDGDGLLDGEEINVYGTSAHAADSDKDGVSDGDEVALGLDPLNADTDADGLADGVEIAEGLNAASPASDADGLNDGAEKQVTRTNPLNLDSDGDGVEDLRVVQTVNGADFVGCYGPYWFSVWTNMASSAVLSSVCDGSPAIQYQVTIEEAGIYHLGLQVDLTAAHTNELNKLPVNLADILVNVTIDGVHVGRARQCFSDELPEYSIFTPWLSEGTHSVKITFHKETYGISGPCVLEALELGLVDGADADADGMADWIGDILDSGLDSDGDGLSDAEELELGTDILSADSDGDGLNDGDELEIGTDPLNADSDGDGVMDGAEVHGSLTNPLEAEFDGTVTMVDTVSGAQTNAAVGLWEAEGSETVSKNVRGSVSYALDFPAGEPCRLTINAAHNWNKSSCTPTIPVDTSAFLIYVDDVYVGKYPLVSADGVYVDVQAFLPAMPAGEHTVKLFWENVYRRLSVRINEVRLESLGGPDNNSNGTKDWIEASLSTMAGVDSATKSYISPACIEGNARYVPFMSIVGGALVSATEDGEASIPPQLGAGDRWYANLPLNQNGTTTSTASFQNGALEIPFTIDWVPYNLMEHDGETLYVRKGDRIKFVVLPEGAHGGRFGIEYTLGMDSQTVRSPNTRPLICLFPSAGTYTVSGQYRKGRKTVTASIQVVALDGTFPEESPACLVGTQRDWSFDGMPSNIVFEVDDTVEMSVVGQSLTTNNNQLTTISLTASEVNGEHMIIARAGEGGPIVDSARLDACWVQNAADGYFWTVESFEDSELWEVESIQQNLPDSVDLRIKVIVGGVTLDDYTTERWITNANYDDTGVYRFRLFHPNGEGSTCHTFMAYQDGQFLGEVFGGGLE